MPKMTDFFNTPYCRARPLVMAWSVLAIMLAWAGTLPDDYLMYVRGIKEPQPYLFLPVIIVCAIAGLVLSGFSWALRAGGWRRIWRLVFCWIASAIITVCAMAGAMHASRLYAYFILAMILLSLLIFIAMLALIAAGLRSRSH